MVIWFLALVLLSSAAAQNNTMFGESYFRQFAKENPALMESLYTTAKRVDWDFVCEKAEIATYRTFDVGAINVTDIFERLVTPVGLINQFILTLEVQFATAVGFSLAGLAWQVARQFIDNPIITGLGALFSVQGVTLTVVRSIYGATIDFISRILVSAAIYGIPPVVTSFLATNPINLLDFLFEPLVIFVTAGRTIITVVFILIALGPIYFFATEIYPSLRPADAGDLADYTSSLVEERQYDDFSSNYDYYDYSSGSSDYTDYYKRNPYTFNYNTRDSAVEETNGWNSVAEVGKGFTQYSF